MLHLELVQEFIRFARDHDRAVYKNDNVSPSSFSSLGAASGATSQPALIYRTGKEQWAPLKGPEAYRRLKELCEVFAHPIVEVWNEELGWKVVSIMDAHQVRENPYRRRQRLGRPQRCASEVAVSEGGL